MSGSGTLHRLEDDQMPGAKPEDNIWLKASAGTGKTQVLSARVLRLLLSGVKPGAILGLTFTKAGAAEMAQRVRGRLAEWVQLNEAALRDQLFMIGADHLNDAVLTRARTLFAEVIDAPGQGLAFQTIHSFCQSLLSAFPLEAGLTPGFRAVEEREAVLQRRDLLSRIADTAVATGDGWFLDGLGRLAERMGEGDALRWLDRCAGKSAALLTLPSEIAPWLRAELDLPASDPDDWLVRWCSGEGEGDLVPPLDECGWREIMAEYGAWDTATGAKMATIIGDWLAAPATARATDLPKLLGTVHTGKGELRADFTKKLAAVADLALRCGEAAGIALALTSAMRSADRLAEALRVGRHFAAAWANEKRAAGLVDFDDLIAHVLQLLDSDGRAEWIRYKLDQRIDHILVDEAQDTNAAQWRIVERLSEEYFAGEGATDPGLRTLFVVGDYKQAIYGFQGTDPVNFAAAERFFRERGSAANRPFAQLSIATNFRSAPAILQAVDAVIARQGPRRLGLDSDQAVHHQPFVGNERQRGEVVLWPVEPASAEREVEEGADGGTEGWIDDATRRIADRIAIQVRRWIDQGIDGEPVKPGDVLVLVRKRKALASLIVARLQAAGVPVAGVDRLRLHAPLAVQDLLAAARFALQPLDDLNLAALLVSPLGGFDQDDLWRYAAERGGVPLWRHLRSQADIADRIEPLRSLLAMADFVSPHRFFETILSGPLRGRAKLLARLGPAARDPIEELLSQALAIGTRDGPSLQHFLAWFDSGDVEIKRESDVAGGEARVMTVHGAKGLEAPIVILADATGNPKAGGRDTGFDWDVDEGRTIPILGMKQEDRPARLAAAHAARTARDEAEHWRLLYVAMTRARQRLYITGALGVQDKGADNLPGPVEDSWYAAIRDALTDLNAGARIEPSWGQAIVHPMRAPSGKAAVRGGGGDTRICPPELPGWATARPGEEPRPPRPLAPSALGDDDALNVPILPAGGGAAARRGVLIHALFERLPAVPVASRADAAARWLAVQAADLGEAARAEMAAAALTTIAHPDYAAIFAPDALGEVPFSALVDGRVIAGVADRLLVSDDAVAVVDLKTGAFVPDDISQVPEAYLKQMAAYAAALSVIFPDRAVRAALLYTGGPRLIAVPADLLAAYRPTRSD